MIEIDGSDLSFDTEIGAKAFCKWYLRSSPSDIEFEDDEDVQAFRDRRLRRLQVQIDDLSKLNFASPITCPIKDITYSKIVPVTNSKPLDGNHSLRGSSRFNYKKMEELRTRAIYLGQDKETCIAEKFHLDIQKKNYAQLIQSNPEDEFIMPDYEVVDYKVSITKILVLTSEASFKAIRVADRVVKDEWFSINQEFDIPTSAQILARIVKNQGFNGIMYSSVRNQTKNNIVLFEENTGSLGFQEVNRYPLEALW